MFGRKKDQQPPIEQTPEPENRPGAKNRPTPTRREAQAARQRPIVPADRKAAAQESKAKQRAARMQQREAMYRGEEWALPMRDRGKERGFIRDVLDARRSFAEFLLPIMLIGLPISLIPNPRAILIGYILVYGAVLLTVIDTFVMWQGVKRRVQEKFGRPPGKGALWYSISRSMQIRPGRIPRPRVKRGEYPS
ncbi:hypothetical protein BJY21_000238 [Kineosphaera limosa]|uniref:DUF3043 domain-containing protein n=1 Tax=Kineosphaera limosa NBRC 100340 TaxID=1184609 RepID=K6WXU7_9MICO|nr:DUF3043 domain-containing protein [Kineosphaera limosa]NYD99053.1 hypothetical protein [Kineosphaera limosa]GAB96912.1 hypothetical protein KILIM_052_00100 [Kineosphaera limosa NBRC 100340]